jgi:type IV secretion system protein VirD4
MTGYDRSLGSPVIGKFYFPHSYFLWLPKYYGVLSLRSSFVTGGLLCVGSMIVGAIISYFISWTARRTLTKTDVHGSARFAEASDIESSGLIKERGIFLGEYRDGRRYKGGVFLRDDNNTHVLVFAPTRSGKGVGFVIPTLLEWKDSVVVYDIKGENWQLTSGWRAAQGHAVLKFEPTTADGTSVRWNPLDEIRYGEYEMRDAQNIADILVDPDGDGTLDHWQLSARTLLTACILHVLYTKKEKNLASVARLLSDPESTADDTLAMMLHAVHDDSGKRGWRDGAGEISRTHPVIQATAREMLNKPEKERGSIISTAINCVSLFRDDPIIARNTETSDFNVRDLKHHEHPVSLYLVVPPSDISRTRALMRIFFNIMGRKLTEKIEPDSRQLLLLLDEFPTLGRLEFFQDALAYIAGYGIRAMLIAQDISQIYDKYGRQESISSNCHVHVVLTPNKIETAENISRTTGEKTVMQHSRNFSGNRQSFALKNISEGLSEGKRNLLTADEVRRLPADKELIFVSGICPILANRFRYYEHKGFALRSKIVAPHTSMKIRNDFKSVFPTIMQPTLTEKLTEGEEHADNHGSDTKTELPSMIAVLSDHVKPTAISNKNSNEDFQL